MMKAMDGQRLAEHPPFEERMKEGLPSSRQWYKVYGIAWMGWLKWE